METLWHIFVAEYPLEANTRETWYAWDAIPDFDRQAVVDGLMKWKRSEDWKDKRFIPNAANFLRRELWKQTPRSAQVKAAASNGIDRHPPSFDSDLYRKKAQSPENYIYKRR